MTFGRINSLTFIIFLSDHVITWYNFNIDQASPGCGFRILPQILINKETPPTLFKAIIRPKKRLTECSDKLDMSIHSSFFPVVCGLYALCLNMNICKFVDTILCFISKVLWTLSSVCLNNRFFALLRQKELKISRNIHINVTRTFSSLFVWTR